MPSHPAKQIKAALKARGLSYAALAEASDVAKQFINEIMHERVGVPYSVAMGLEKLTGQPAEYWVGLQAAYDLEKLRE